MIQKITAATAHQAADTCSELAGLGVLFPKTLSTGKGAMKLMGQPPVTHRAIPFQKNSVPSVVMNDGIRVRTVIRPLSNPIRPAMPSTVMTESAAGTAAFKSMPSTIAENVKFEPTDRSNSVGCLHLVEEFDRRVGPQRAEGEDRFGVGILLQIGAHDLDRLGGLLANDEFVHLGVQRRDPLDVARGLDLQDAVSRLMVDDYNVRALLQERDQLRRCPRR